MLDQLKFKEKPPPYSLRINDMRGYFGFEAQTIRNWINVGKLRRGYHYLKVGRSVCIIREKFIEFMKEVDGNGDYRAE